MAMKKRFPESSGEGPEARGEFLLYTAEDGRTRIDCRFDGQTIWLTQAQIAELFQTSVPNINLHLKAVYAEGELDETATVKSYLIVRSEGSRQVSREVLHYNLSAVLAVGYRVRSPRGTQFRQWATAKLEEYLRKGFVMDDARLKNPPGPGVPDYFDELLERIRDIRSSEARMYLRVRDVFALAADYQPNAPEVMRFFQIIQNKLHWAATGHTAPEIIAARADHVLPNMGLTAWSGAKVRKHDVTVAKNYLNAEEISELNTIVSMFLDYAADQAKRKKQVFLREWETRLNDWLTFNERKVLPDAGKVSRAEAEAKAVDEYDKFHARRLEWEEQASAADFEDVIRRLPKPSREKPQ